MNSLTDKENRVRQWFAMWLDQRDSGICDIFAEQALYTESWGPEYRGVDKIKLWFAEWNTRGRVLRWDISQFLHQGEQTVVQWYFQYQMQDEALNAFEGLSLIAWDAAGKIASLQEFGCNLHRYDPYRKGTQPQFAADKPLWF